jgi:hypothetical protein
MTFRTTCSAAATRSGVTSAVTSFRFFRPAPIRAPPFVADVLMGHAASASTGSIDPSGNVGMRCLLIACRTAASVAPGSPSAARCRAYAARPRPIL